jgi:hypothetical protein
MTVTTAYIKSSQTSLAVAQQRLPMADVPLTLDSCTIPGLRYSNFWLTNSRLVKLLLAFASTVIPGFSLLEIHVQDFYFLLNVYVFWNWAFSPT